MNSYEIAATVGEGGQVRVAGVPFAPGTEVNITITPKVPSVAQVTASEDDALASARARMQELFGTIKGFRNSPRIPREELYERGRVP